MSRCVCCDAILSDSELVAKRVMPDGTEEFWDTCGVCKTVILDPSPFSEELVLPQELEYAGV
jgi:hypothetical protein